MNTEKILTVPVLSAKEIEILDFLSINTRLNADSLRKGIENIIKNIPN